nr:hypothetical protein [Tanacetum cinerariifolium]
KRRKLNEEVEDLKQHLEIVPDEDDDVEDLESLWSIVKERFSTSKPNKFSDDYLLATLRTMFERPDGQDQVWKSQRSVHGQAKWRERFMNYLEEQTDGEAMINSIQNGDQPLPVIAQVSLVGTTQNAPPTLKDLKFWNAEEKKTRKIDRLARPLLIQGLPNDISSLIDSNETAKDLWDSLERQMRGSKYGEQYRKAAILYEYETFKANEGEQLIDT